ncbi:growth/differentiation factor 11-like, partial [Saccoglossus kowalevskii]|uniref:Growth/differentiation factor 11-like n=2 Tax=Saccoglossus kowalevskii TaxID=10224 RepID=A0ABM0GQ25_SACKO
PNKFMKPEHTSHGYSFFEFSPQVRDAQIIEARLHVYIRQQEAVQTTATWLHIYELGPPGKHHYNKIACSRKIELSSRKGHWEQFDIQRVVFGWFHDHESNWGLDIDATDHEGNSVVVTSSDWGSEDHQRMPYLELRTRQHNLRHKRSPELNCDEKSEEERCCRYPLVVDFVELTWDWIIAPKTYSAYYCAGECPNVYNLQNAHSYFVERANPRGHAGRCCTGSEMSPISMIYFIDEKSIMFGVVPDMVTIKCECS